jgi:hypothetical protein
MLVVALTLTAAPCINATPQDDIELIQKNAPRMAAIISSVVSQNGHVDEAMHAEFWSLLPQSVRANPRSFVGNLEIIRSMTYQKELWESIRLSARAGTEVKTLSYASALTRALGDGPTGLNAARRADQMLAAAATGEPFQGREGAQLLTEEQANQVLDGLNASTARLQLLMEPAWHDPKDHL